jgi:hypothetical protein
MSRKIVGIYVQYGFEKYDQALSDFHRVLCETFPNSPTEVYVVENKCNVNEDTEFYFQGSRFHLVNGDNRYREFSGWERVFKRYIRKKYTDDTILVFATSAFMQQFTRFIQAFKEIEFNKLVGESFLVGHVDYMNYTCSVLDRKITHWIRTSIFITNKRTMASLDSLFYAFDNDLVLGNLNESNYEYFDDVYKDHVLNWLVRKKPMQNVVWHGSIDLENRNELAGKTMAMLNELLLTQNIIKKGFRIFDAGHLLLCSMSCKHTIEHQVMLRAY